MKYLNETNVKRREFLKGGVAGGILGVAGGGFFVNITHNFENMDALSSIHLEDMPTLEYYPLTQSIELFRLYWYLASLILSSGRDTEPFNSLRNDVWSEVRQRNFFLYGNELMLRVHTLTGDSTLKLPSDHTVARMALHSSMKLYPVGWSRLVKAYVAYTPTLAKAFLIRGL